MIPLSSFLSFSSTATKSCCFLLCRFSANRSFSDLFLQKIHQYFAIRIFINLFIAVIVQLGGDVLQLVCAACCHHALVFGIMYFCNNNAVSILSSFYIFFF